MVANYVDFAVRANRKCFSLAGPPDYCGPASYHGVAARLYHNMGGRFQDVSRTSGIGGVRAPGLGISCADFDGDDDILITHLVNEGVTLFQNDGHANFQDVTAARGLQNSTFRFTGFGSDWFDYDNDGRVDIVVTDNNDPARVLLNQAATQNHWLEVRLEGVKSNRMGLGARAAVIRKGRNPVWRRCHSDGSYCSASDSRVHFGLGGDSTLEAVIVQWPNGAREIWNGIHTDRTIALREGTGHRR